MSKQLGISITTESQQFKPVDLDRWAQITIEQWQFNLANKLHISNRTRTVIYEDESLDHLIDSFTFHVAVNANGQEALISYAFNYYFRMLDAGWGNPPRPRSKVFTKDLFKSVFILSKLLAEQYAVQGAAQFTTTMIDAFEEGQRISHQLQPEIRTDRLIEIDTGNLPL